MCGFEALVFHGTGLGWICNEKKDMVKLRHQVDEVN
ncbi:MAG: hypothetical protein K0Q66_912 [Chitinophagaceae bacterium]|jgi:hypothetical protein|nr:hypothetical protein [Chitinophagaceae bacterium]